MKAAGHIEKDKTVQLAILLNVIGEEAVEVFNTFNLSEADRKGYQKVMDAFEG